MRVGPRDDARLFRAYTQAAVTLAKAHTLRLAFDRGLYAASLGDEIALVFPRGEDPSSIIDSVTRLSPIVSVKIGAKIGENDARGLLEDADVLLGQASGSRIGDVLVESPRGIERSIPDRERLVDADIAEFDNVLSAFAYERARPGCDPFSAGLTKEVDALHARLQLQCEGPLQRDARALAMLDFVDQLRDVIHEDRAYSRDGITRGVLKLAVIPAFGGDQLVLEDNNGSFRTLAPDMYAHLPLIGQRVRLTRTDEGVSELVLERSLEREAGRSLR